MTDTTPLELDAAVPGGRVEMVAIPGGRVEMVAIPDDDYPGGWFYRFQYYHPGEGELLRYDNAHDDPDLGRHHRHVTPGDDTEIPFQNITAHIARFFQELEHLTTTDPDSDP